MPEFYDDIIYDLKKDRNGKYHELWYAKAQRYT